MFNSAHVTTLATTNFRLGHCVVNVTAYELNFDDGRKVSLQAKFVEVLQVLAQQAPQVVTRDQLINSVWNGNHLIGQNALTNAIWQLRQALGSAIGEPGGIETVRKSGYRITLPVEYLIPADVEHNERTALPQTVIAAARAAVTPWVDATPPTVITQITQRQLNRRRALRTILYVLSVLFLLALYWLSLGRESIWISQPLTFDPGRELYPAVSPDGRYLAYLRVASGVERQLMIKDLQTPNAPATPLKTDDSKQSGATWDTQGRALIFAAKRPNGDCQIRRVDLATQTASTIASCESPLPSKLAISADGRYLAFAVQGKLMQLDRQQSGAALTSLPCNAPCPVSSTGNDVAYSPDGQSIAFVQRTTGVIEDLYWMNIGSGETRRISNGHYDIRGLEWSADSQSILYGAIDNMRRDGIWVNLNTGQQQRLNTPGFSHPARANADTYYFHHWLVHRSIGSLQWPGNGSPLPLLRSLHYYTDADYSAANDSYVLISNQSGYNEVWLYDPNKNQQQKISQIANPAYHPRWSPDGKFVAFVAPKDDLSGNDLYVIDVQNQRTQKIKTGLAAVHFPAWFPDQQHLLVNALVAGKSELYRLTLSDGNYVRLTQHEAIFGMVDNRDGAIYFTRAMQAGIWRYNADGEPQAVTDKRCNAQFNWTVSAGGLFCAQIANETYQVWHFTSDNDTGTLVSQMPEGMIAESGRFAYDQKRQRLIFTMDEPSEADIMVLNRRVTDNAKSAAP